MSYTTDLTDEQFELLDSIIPKSKTKWNIIPRRKIFNAIFYQLKNGCQWRDLPKEFPKWETVYSQFRRWKQREVWKSALLILAELERVKLGKNEIPSLLLGDSQVVKNTNTASIKTKGFCNYKNVNGIKRHLLVDVLGNPYFTKATKANLSDDEGLIEIIQDNQNFFLNLPDNHVITILLDNGYHKQKLEKEIKKINPDLLKYIKIEITEKINPKQREESKKKNPKKQGFVVQYKRWIVERTNAWVNQCRVLWKNCEGKLCTSEAKIRLCSIRLILRRLCPT